MSTDLTPPEGRLFCRGGRLKGTAFTVKGSSTLGSGADCDCRIEDPSVAEQHARIIWDEAAERFVVEDLGSPLGTQVDGVPVQGSRPLDRLHVLTFGEIGFVFQQVEAARPQGPPKSPQTQRLDSVPTIPAGLMFLGGEVPMPTWSLEVEIDGEWLRYELHEGENRVGRVAADVVLPSREISRLHAAIIVSGREVSVRDLGSTNFTFLDGERLLVETRVPLGGKLAFGPHPARILATHD